MNHVKGVGHRKPPVQSRIKTSLNLSIVKAMQSLAHYWWNHTSFRIKKVYFRHTFDIFSWRALNYAVLIITDYEMHLLGYKIQLLKRILRKAHYIFKSREPCFKLCMHSWTKHFNAFTVSSPSFLSEISGFFSYNVLKSSTQTLCKSFQMTHFLHSPKLFIHMLIERIQV